MNTTFKVLPLIFGLALLFAQCEKEQFVTIADDNFLKALIEEGVDTNGDGQISSKEAEALSNLDISGTYEEPGLIIDMSGIEKFVNLDTLNCDHNQLASLDISNNTALIELSCLRNQLSGLDVSNNTALIVLNCSRNQLTSLDVSNNIALTKLICFDNPLTSLDVSNNTSLTELVCDDNQLTSLDVSNNTVLTKLICNNNQLTSLDVSNNTALIALWLINNQLTSLDVSNNTSIRSCGPYCGGGLFLRDMPSLHEVCVWTLPFPPEGVPIDITNSPNVYFTTECSK